MRKIKNAFAIMLVIACSVTGFSGCGKSAKKSDGNVKDKDVEVVDEVNTEQPNQNEVYDELFNFNNKVTVKMDISDSELKKLQADYDKYDSMGSKSPIYRMVNKMTITIGSKSYVINEVGIRLKGNTSRVDLYNKGNLNDRNLVHFKISFKQTFDDEVYGTDAKKWDNDADRKARKNRTFAGLEGMELKWNRSFDSTYICNFYTNQMFRAFGVYAQNTTLANVNFGGYNYGVYTLYEPIDENYVRRNIEDEADWDGDLYKCAWANIGNGWSGADYTTNSAKSIGMEDEDACKFYVYDLKTNKKKSDNSKLNNLITTLNSSSSLSKETFASVVDADNWVKFAAVSYFVGNPDDMRNNYNNHYVYILNNSGKAVFLPYDNDRSFGVKFGWNVQNGMQGVNPFSETAQGQGNKQGNPLYKYSVIRKNNSINGNNFSAEYQQALAQVANSEWMKYDNFKKYYDIANKNYASVAVPDSNVKAYVGNDSSNHGDYNLSGDTSRLKFAESNSYNVKVSDYMNNILTTYKNAIK